MRLLTAYRHQLAEEAAGRSDRFKRILRALRRVWFGFCALAVAWLGWGAWYVIFGNLPDGGGMALIIFPMGALALVLVGAVPYSIGQLFLSARRTNG